MLASILRAAGAPRRRGRQRRASRSLDAVLADPPYDVLAVEVSSFQLHWTSTVEFARGAVLNVAPDHLDWHGSLEAYAADKALVWRSDWYAVYNADDPIVSALVAQRSRTPQSFTLRATPRRRGFGLVDDQLVDRGIGTDRASRSTRRRRRRRAGRAGRRPVARPAQRRERARRRRARPLAAQRDRWPARGPPGDVRGGLRAFDPGAHRIAHVATVAGVDYVDDSKATNPHAAAASLAAYPPVVWVAGGLAKGATFDELVTGAATGCAASC